jgi:hypothetical protein
MLNSNRRFGGDVVRPSPEAISVLKFNDPEDGGCKLCRNVWNCLPDHMALRSQKTYIFILNQSSYFVVRKQDSRRCKTVILEPNSTYFSL